MQLVSYPFSPIPPHLSWQDGFSFPFLRSMFAPACLFQFASISSKLLLNKERTQMRELPSAGGAEDDELNDDPSNDAGVGRLGLISEFGLSLL